MTKKGKHIDVLGEAHLPADLMTPTLGDGFGVGEFPDMEYGMGVLEGFFPSDESGLPDGITAEEESRQLASLFADADTDLGMNLTETMKEGGLADLSWLELNEQDPNRLPENPVYLGIPELEEAWGVERRTDGLHFQNNVDIEQARYEESLTASSKPKYKFAAADLGRVVRKAMRRSAAGHSMRDILIEAAEALGDEAHRIRNIMAAVQAEHGLAGNVYIRASAYPGYEQGKWKEHLRKVASNARYILVDEKTLTGSTHIHDGHCSVTKKRAVTTVPWDEALTHYVPILEATGRKMIGGHPNVILRTAFLSRAPSTIRETAHPTHVAPSQRVSSEEAKQAFAEAPRPERTVYDPRVAQRAQERKAAWAKINAWVEAGFVPVEQAMAISQDDLTGREMLHRVSALVLRTKGASAFSGLSNDMRPPQATEEEARTALAAVQAPAPIDISDRPRKAAKRDLLLQLARWAKHGFITKTDAQRLAQSEAEPFDVLRAASKLASAPSSVSDYSGVANDPRTAVEASQKQVWASLRKAEKRAADAQAKVDELVQSRRVNSTQAARRVVEADARIAKVVEAIDKGVRGEALRSLIARSIPREERPYAVKKLAAVLQKTGALTAESEGPRTYDARAYRPVAQRVASISPNIREATAAVGWVRRAMNEGSAGKELDSLIQVRFSKAVLAAASEKLAALRDEHEGGAGFVYVDAGAYASKTGTKGCEEGGLKHRSNSLKFVLAMDRCKSCALRGAMADGTHQCQKYNKMVVTADDLPDNFGGIRHANIKSANMTDFEETASMFAPTFDADEFGLRSAELDSVDVADVPESENLGEILFGGLEW